MGSDMPTPKMTTEQEVIAMDMNENAAIMKGRMLTSYFLQLTFRRPQGTPIVSIY